MRGVGVGGRHREHRSDGKLIAGARNSHRNLAAIGDAQPLEARHRRDGSTIGCHAKSHAPPAPFVLVARGYAGLGCAREIIVFLRTARHNRTAAGRIAGWRRRPRSEKVQICTTQY